jgi:hypothetical protein
MVPEPVVVLGDFEVALVFFDHFVDELLLALELPLAVGLVDAGQDLLLEACVKHGQILIMPDHLEPEIRV